MYETGFAYLLQAEHEKVIYGVLKRLNVSRQSPDYEDLVVEGQIAFAQAYCTYCQTHDSVTEKADRKKHTSKLQSLRRISVCVLWL